MSCRAICKATAGIIIASAFAIGAVLPVLPAPSEPTSITPSHILPAMATKPPAEPVEEASVAAVVATPEPTPAPTPKSTVMSTQHIASASQTAPSGTHQDWMAAAGIPESDWGYVDWIITRESGWRPSAVNPYGCIGLGQNCPDKNGNLWLVAACPNWQSDPVCQLRRFTVYAQGRYGGWAQSVITWQRQGWW